MSSPALFGLPGQVKKLLDRLTVTRAGNLDKLDDTITSRADGALWTSTRASYLDGSVNATKTNFKQKAFPISGTWAKPSGVTAVHILLVGGGGGGSGAYSDISFPDTVTGGGGGGGQVIELDVYMPTTATTVYIDLGEGGGYGNGYTQTPDNGATGGNSRIYGTGIFTITAYGGEGGSFADRTHSATVGSGGGEGGGHGPAYSSSSGGGGGASSKGEDGLPDGVYSDGSQLQSGKYLAGAIFYGNPGGRGTQDKAKSHGGHGGAGIKGFGGGGGGGGTDNGGGGSDGGGHGGHENSPYAGHAIANTGSGGGGASAGSSAGIYRGGNGGKGFCIISWLE